MQEIQEIQETQAGYLGWEDPLEEEMATRSSILAWKIPLTEEHGGLQFMGLQRVRNDWVTEYTCTIRTRYFLNRQRFDHIKTESQLANKHGMILYFIIYQGNKKLLMTRYFFKGWNKNWQEEIPWLSSG